MVATRVTRYSPTIYWDGPNAEDAFAEMIEYLCGDYVEHNDYEALEDDYKALQIRYDKLCEKIRSLYLETP